MERIKYGKNIDKKTRQSGRFDESKDEAGDKEDEVDDKDNYMY